MPDAIAQLRDVELAKVEAAVGSSSFRRGRGYARNRVLAIEWDPTAETLTGSVVGQGALYDTAAFFAAEPDGASIEIISSTPASPPSQIAWLH